MIHETETYSIGNSNTNGIIGNVVSPRHAQIKVCAPKTTIESPVPHQSDLEKIRTADNEPDFRNLGSEIIHGAAHFLYSDRPSSNDFEHSSRQYLMKQMHKSHHYDQLVGVNPDKIDLDILASEMSPFPDFQIHATHTAVVKSPTTDHIYEEIGLITGSSNTSKYDIMDYYEKYSPTTAKMLIDTLFLPGHKICKICAAMQRSVIYSDRLIKFNEPLYAKEVALMQIDDYIYFRYTADTCYSNFGRFLDNYDFQNFLPIHNTVKPNTSGIFYSDNFAIDVFDTKSTLEPSIRLVDTTFQGLGNTDLYHRKANHFLSRISANGFSPMVFNSVSNNFMKTITSVSYNTDLNNSMNYRKDVVKLRNSKSNELPLSVIEPHPDRSSLLLLEPLLLMPELSNPRRKPAKNRITHSEHLRIVRMMIAYTLAFFLLAIITFYIIYFT